MIGKVLKWRRGGPLLTLEQQWDKRTGHHHGSCDLGAGEADNLLLIKGAIPGAEGDYVVIRESKKRPKGWTPPVSHAPMKRKGAAEKKPEAKPAEAKK